MGNFSDIYFTFSENFNIVVNHKWPIKILLLYNADNGQESKKTIQFNSQKRSYLSISL